MDYVPDSAHGMFFTIWASKDCFFEKYLIRLKLLKRGEIFNTERAEFETTKMIFENQEV